MDFFSVTHNTFKTIYVIIIISNCVFDTPFKSITCVNILNTFFICCPCIWLLICILPAISVWVGTIVVCDNIVRVGYIFGNCEVVVPPHFIVLGLVKGHCPFQYWTTLSWWICRNSLPINNLIVSQLSIFNLSTFFRIPTINSSFSIFINVFNILSFHRAFLTWR